MVNSPSYPNETKHNVNPHVFFLILIIKTDGFRSDDFYVDVLDKVGKARQIIPDTHAIEVVEEDKYTFDSRDTLDNWI